MIRLLCLGLVLLYVATLPERNTLDDVKLGAVTLLCNDKVVPSDRVVDFVDGTWVFDNGSARNCDAIVNAQK